MRVRHEGNHEGKAGRAQQLIRVGIPFQNLHKEVAPTFTTCDLDLANLRPCIFDCKVKKCIHFSINALAKFSNLALCGHMLEC